MIEPAISDSIVLANFDFSNLKTIRPIFNHFAIFDCPICRCAHVCPCPNHVIRNSESDDPPSPPDSSNLDAPNDDAVDIKPTIVLADLENIADDGSFSSSSDNSDCSDPWYWHRKWEEFRREGRINEETNKMFGEKLEKVKKEKEEALAVLVKVIVGQEEFRVWQESLMNVHARGCKPDFQPEFEGTRLTPVHK